MRSRFHPGSFQQKGQPRAYATWQRGRTYGGSPTKLCQFNQQSNVLYRANTFYKFLYGSAPDGQLFVRLVQLPLSSSFCLSLYYYKMFVIRYTILTRCHTSAMFHNSRELISIGSTFTKRTDLSQVIPLVLRMITNLWPKGCKRIEATPRCHRRPCH